MRLPRSLCQELGAWLAGRPHGPDDLVFTAPRGGPIREHKLMERYFKPAIQATNQAIATLPKDQRPAELPATLRMHDLTT